MHFQEAEFYALSFQKRFVRSPTDEGLRVAGGSDFSISKTSLFLRAQRAPRDHREDHLRMSGISASCKVVDWRVGKRLPS